jgi:phosphate transport system substrate-binding protein
MALAREAALETGLQIRVEPSIGSEGGIAAASDGAVDLGLVSRPLRPGEGRELLRVDLARDAVVLAAAPDVSLEGLSDSEVHQLYRGELPGTTLLLPDAEESANEVLESAFPGLAAERRTAAASGRFRVLDHDDEMAVALAATPRGVGVLSYGSLRWPLRALLLDGRVPSVQALAADAWPAVRSLGVVFRPERRARVTPFLAFVTSERGRAITRAMGYLPLETRR